VVEHDRWNDVALEIAHHPDHTYDLASMRRGMKDSLDYFTRAFGPYQHPVLRIVEFPGYATFAESFSSTIPFSESIGFIAEVEKGRPDAIDYPLYVTAHEVAHHWWGHQVLSADAQGMTTLVETLAQYSALMVMKHAYGPQVMRRFLIGFIEAIEHSEHNQQTKRQCPRQVRSQRRTIPGSCQPE
jgi:aminopeptidase N